jgi:hypothetical protein
VRALLKIRLPRIVEIVERRRVYHGQQMVLASSAPVNGSPGAVGGTGCP